MTEETRLLTETELASIKADIQILTKEKLKEAKIFTKKILDLLDERLRSLGKEKSEHEST